MVMNSTARTVNEYLNNLPADRRSAIEAVVEMVRANMPEGYEESMEWGMVCWQVPLSTYPKTYNGKPLMYTALASQKNHMALYITAPYMMPGMDKKFREEYIATGKKLDMGKSCVRFKKLDDLPLELLGRYLRMVPPEKLIEADKAVHSK
jgi:hypothetical protein